MNPSTLRRVTRSVLLLALATSLIPHSSKAQATGTPTFFAPTRGFENMEAGLSASGGGGSDDVGVEGRYGFSLRNWDISLRAGQVDGGTAGTGRFVAGVEARIPVIGHDRNFALDGALIFGVGHSFGGSGGKTFVPLGLSLGRRIVLDGGDLQLTPYVQPTVIFQSDSAFSFGLGLDIHTRDLPDIRLNWAAGDLDGFAVSLFWAR